TETGSYAASLEADPARLEALHERRAALTDLVRGLGAEAAADDPDPLAGVLAFAERARARVGELTAPGGGREAIEERLAQAVADEQAAAAAVTENRRRAAEGPAAPGDAEPRGLARSGSRRRSPTSRPPRPRSPRTAAARPRGCRRRWTPSSRGCRCAARTCTSSSRRAPRPARTAPRTSSCS